MLFWHYQQEHNSCEFYGRDHIRVLKKDLISRVCHEKENICDQNSPWAAPYGGQGVRTPSPPEISQNYRVSWQYWSITKLPRQYSIQASSKLHFLQTRINSTRKWIGTHKNEPVHEISYNVVCATSEASDQPAHMRSLIRAFPSRLSIVWLLSNWLNTI